MKTPAVSGKQKSLFFALLTIVCFCACFIFSPLGGFMVWIFTGATLYFLFMAIYSLVPVAKHQHMRKRINPKDEEAKAYIRYHTQILVSIFLGGVLLVVVILFFL